jgi:hypothetical protein
MGQPTVPFDVPEQDTVRDLIGKAVRANQSPDPAITASHAHVYAMLAQAKANADIADALYDVANAIRAHA